MNWPQFEEYTEEFREITGGKSKGRQKDGHIGDGNITLVNQRTINDDLPEYLSTGSNAVKKTSRDHRNGKSGTLTATTGTTNGTGLTRTANNAEYRSTISNGGLPSSTAPTDRSPFDEEGEEWDENPDGVDQIDPLIDTGEPGVKVRALYDYEAAESDELDFKAGDMFEKLEDEDEQGWCKGRKDGKVGLYPANYIEVI